MECAGLELKRYVYFWVDGIHFNVRLDEERSCILVIMGANESGRKELLAVSDGYRESKASWREILLDLKRRGLKIGPRLAVGDGALGFWAALREVYPGCGEQRCWVHKTANVLDKMPKSVQGKAKGMLHEMWQAPTKEKALAAYGHFLSSWEEKYPKAVDCLQEDKESCSPSMTSPRHMDPHQDDQPHRIQLRHGEAAHEEDQRMRFANGDANDGIQTGPGGGENLAAAHGAQTDRAGDTRAAVRRW